MIAWLDLETTGTDENAPYAKVLEIGVVFTDLELQEKCRFQLAINPAYDAGEDLDESTLRDELDLVWERMDPFVQNMHTANGLWKDVQRSVVSTRRADEFFAQYLQQFKHTQNVKELKLAGSGVSWFDLQWIREFLPLSAAEFSRGPIDIGVVRRFLRDVVGYDVTQADPEGTSGDHAKKRHRALDDAKAHLQEAKFYRDLFQANLDLEPANTISHAVQQLVQRMRGMSLTKTEAAELRQHIAVAERVAKGATA